VVPKIKVLSGCSASTKKKFVVALRQTGEIVAVTGNTTNDAQALVLIFFHKQDFRQRGNSFGTKK
jgi:soluble P-type ATPase